MNNIDNLNHIWPEWRIIEHIGNGSYGQVYKAICNEYSTPIYSAIKMITIPNNETEIMELKAEGLNEKVLKEYYRQKLKRYISEIELMETFKGTANVVNIEDYNVIEKNDSIGFVIYIRMELLTPFNEYIKKNVLTQKDIIKLGIDICSALELFEKNHIIHRDIKPENLFVSEHGAFKVGDLGVAKKLNPNVSVPSAKGTYSYMAPEVVYGKSYNIRADIYSLGIVLYKLCNKNRLPFVNTDSDEIDMDERKNINSRRLKGEKLPKPVNADDYMAAVILHACEYSPDERFQTSTEFKNALIAIDNGKKIIFSKHYFFTIKLKVIIGIIVLFFLSILMGILIFEKSIPILQITKNTESDKGVHTMTQEVIDTVNDSSEDNLVSDTEYSKQETTETDSTTESEQGTQERETITDDGRETMEQETAERETTEKETAERETTEKETAERETTEKETAERETTELETPIEKPGLESEETETSTEEESETVCEGYIVPEGCIYITNDMTYSEGMIVEDTPAKGHRLVTKDYIYSYELCNFERDIYYEGWNVRVINSTQTEYEDLLGNIAGKKLMMMNRSYDGCVNMKEVPKIPEGVEVLYYTYSNCDAVEVAPIIPEGIKWMYHTFGNCGSLKVVPVIPGSVEKMEYTFEQCYNLETISEISGSVEYWEYTFHSCKKLTNIPDIPQGVYSLEGAFSGCWSLKETPYISEGVTNLKETFYNCNGLIKVTNIPDSVTDMTGTFSFCSELQEVPELPSDIRSLDRTFYNCIKLSEVPEIPKYVTSMIQTFGKCESLIEAPKIPNTVTNMSQTFIKCKSLKMPPVIPINVKDMSRTFSECFSLSGEMVINANPTEYGGCFEHIYLNNQNLTLTGSSTMLEELRSTSED